MGQSQTQLVLIMVYHKVVPLVRFSLSYLWTTSLNICLTHEYVYADDTVFLIVGRIAAVLEQEDTTFITIVNVYKQYSVG